MEKVNGGQAVSTRGVSTRRRWKTPQGGAREAGQVTHRDRALISGFKKRNYFNNGFERNDTMDGRCSENILYRCDL